MIFCVCIVFSRIGERIDQTLTSVFEQEFSGLRLFLLDNACQDFDNAGFEKFINQHKIGNNVNIIISRNSRRANGLEVFKQCAKAAEGCNFTILCPGEIFANPTILSQAYIQLQKNTLFYVKCGDETIPFFSKDFNMSLRLDSEIVSVRRALDKVRRRAPLLDEKNTDQDQWINREKLKLNYSDYLQLKTIIGDLIRIRFSRHNLYNFERDLHKNLLEVFNRNMKSCWDISESKRAYVLYMQQILEMFVEVGTKWGWIRLKKDMKILLDRTKVTSESKLKIVFFAQEYSVWPSLQSFYDACNKDERFIAQHVYIPFRHENSDLKGFEVSHAEMEPYWKAGYPIMPYTMYDLSKESPDVAVFVKPYDLIPKQFSFYEVEKIVKRCMYICYGFEGSNFIDYQFRLPFVNKIWKYTVFGECVKEAYTKYGYRNGENCVVWGNPRVDSIDKIKNATIPAEWNEKINGRKVILWTPHHTIEYGTFFEYKNVIFKYFEDNKDIFLLFRPHPLMLQAIIKNGILTDNDVIAIINMIEQSDNIILDTSPSYREAFSVSDAIMTDPTSFLKEYLILDRPILYTTGSTKEKHIFPEMNDAWHIATFPEHILDFLEMVKIGNDYKQKDRERIRTKFIFMPLGGVGEYIKEQVIKSILEEENIKLEII
jgi:hypothetical protein